MASELPASLKTSLEASKCEYRRLGNSGLKVSVPIFGCMSFGDDKAQSWALNEDEVSYTSNVYDSLDKNSHASPTILLSL
jgi:hypothetical protein